MRLAAKGGYSEDGWTIAMSEGVLRKTIGVVSGNRPAEPERLL